MIFGQKAQSQIIYFAGLGVLAGILVLSILKRLNVI